MTSRYLIDIENRKSKIIHVYRNGDKYNRAVLVLLRPIEQQKLERIFKAIEEKVTLPYNKPIKRIFSHKGNEIDDPIMIKDQKYYIVSSSENFINIRYGSIIKWAIIGPVKWSKFADVFYEPPAQDDMAVGNKILYRWKNNTTNSARLSTKMTKSLSAYPSDRKPLRNSKMMTLSMDQSKRPISEPSNDMKDVNRISNTENSFFHLSDEKNSSGDNSVTSPKILSNRNHKSMDQFLNDSLKMYQLNDSNTNMENENIDHPEKGESKSEEKSETINGNIKNEELVSLTNIEENRSENELEDSKIQKVCVDSKENENDEVLSNCNENNKIEKDFKNTTNGETGDNFKIDADNISENQINESDDISIKCDEIELELDKSNLESKNSEIVFDEENESHNIINSNNDYQRSSDGENLVENNSLMKDVVLEIGKSEESLDNDIMILKKDNEQIQEMKNIDVTDNATHSTEDHEKDIIYSDERNDLNNVDDENDDSVKIDTDISHTDEESDLVDNENSDLKASENTAQIQRNEKHAASLSREHSQIVQNDDEISENKVDQIMYTDSSNIDQQKQSLNNSTNDVKLFENTESNSDQEDGNAKNDFSSNFEKSEEIKDLHELIKSPCSELNTGDDDDIDNLIKDPLKQKQENYIEDKDDLKDDSDSQIDNYKNELENTLENSGKYSTVLQEENQSDNKHEINNEELNTIKDINDDNLFKITSDNKIDSGENEADLNENNCDIENRGKINEIQLKKDTGSELSFEKNETDKEDNNNNDYKSDGESEESEIDGNVKNGFSSNFEKSEEIKDLHELIESPCSELNVDDDDIGKSTEDPLKQKQENYIEDIDVLKDENENSELETESQSNKDTEIKDKDHSELCESVSTKDENYDKLNELLSKRSKTGSISEHDSSDNENFDNKFDYSFGNTEQNQKDIIDLKSDSDINPKEQFNRIDLKLSDSSDCFEENTSLSRNFSNQEDHKTNDSLEQFNRIDFMFEEPSNCINDKQLSVDSDNENQDSNKIYEISSDKNNLEQYNRIDIKADDPIGFITDKTKSLTDVSENDDSDLNEDDKVSNVTENSMENIQTNIKDDTNTTGNIHNFNKDDDEDNEKKKENDSIENLKLEIESENLTDLLYMGNVENDKKEENKEIESLKLDKYEENDKNEIKINSENLSELPDKELDEEDAAVIIQKNFRGHLVRNELAPHTQQINTDEFSENEIDKNKTHFNNHEEKVMDTSKDLSQIHKQELDENDAAKIIQKNFREHLVKNDLLSGAKQTIPNEEKYSENELNKTEDVENNESHSENEDFEMDNAAKIIQKNFRRQMVRKDLPQHSENPYGEDLHSQDELNEIKSLHKDHKNDKSDASMNLAQLPDENVDKDNAAKIIQKNFRGHLVRKELNEHTKHVNAEEDIESEDEQNRSYEQKDSEYDENDPDVNFSLMKDATNDLNTDEILDDHSQFDNSYPDDAFLVNNKL